jgi:signal transduction histidine kinase/CheY-like chemotaxis protein
MRWPILRLNINHELDVVAARQRALQIANLLGFERQDQSRIATAVSEIARNAFNYAHGGRVEFLIENLSCPQVLLVEVVDKGPGISELAAILEGRYQSTTGMGLGITGARRLMDECDFKTEGTSGTRVLLRKTLPAKAPTVTPSRISEIANQLLIVRQHTVFEEIQHQNAELLRLLDELAQCRDNLARLDTELEDTNRGVVALYAELDENTVRLREADQMKSRFLSNMSHEFRTPLNSIIALSQLLLRRSDGDLTEEQERQVTFIHHGAGGLLEMVNDLLDLAKIEAGKVEVHSSEFKISSLFSTLRGVFRPILPDKELELIFDDSAELTLHTDEAKLTQILRNFISNALKFTERGEVRVRISVEDGGQTVTFLVSDTGIGINPVDQVRIFEEFTQVENRLQGRSKGTGLGLPLSRRLALLLGGTISVESEPGTGSVFSVSIPVCYQAGEQQVPVPSEVAVVKPASGPQKTPIVLLIDDDDSARYLLAKMLKELPVVLVEASSAKEGLSIARKAVPGLILLDLNMPGLSGSDALTRLKDDPLTSGIPVIIVTSQSLTTAEREELMVRARAILSKEHLLSDKLLEEVNRALSSPEARLASARPDSAGPDCAGPDCD